MGAPSRLKSYQGKLEGNICKLMPWMCSPWDMQPPGPALSASLPIARPLRSQGSFIVLLMASLTIFCCSMQTSYIFCLPLELARVTFSLQHAVHPASWFWNKPRMHALVPMLLLSPSVLPFRCYWCIEAVAITLLEFILIYSLPSLASVPAWQIGPL